MARAALGWRAEDAAQAASVSRMTVARFEAGKQIADQSADALQAAFENAGVEFIPAGVRSATGGEGVRLRAS